jgi:hypothetical protein
MKAGKGRGPGARGGDLKTRLLCCASVNGGGQCMSVVMQCSLTTSCSAESAAAAGACLTARLVTVPCSRCMSCMGVLHN